MKLSDPHRLIREVIDAHGGEAYWNSLEALDAEISVSGLLFTVKWCPILKHVHIRASTREPRFTFFDFPNRGQTSELMGEDEVSIKEGADRVTKRRLHPRSAFRSHRHQFYWDSLDFIYFGGYATWNYLVTPFLFLRPGFEFELIDPLPRECGSWSRLRVTFPTEIPTHCKRQVFYFDKDRHLRRLDYIAMVVGRWAHAAHLCNEYRKFDNIKAPTRRRVLPLIFGKKLLPWPILVAVDVHDIHPVPAASESVRNEV